MSGMAPRTFPDGFERLPKLQATLLPLVKRVYPTAVRLVLHPQRQHDRYGFAAEWVTLAAFDRAARLLAPLRVEEAFDLLELLQDKHGSGLRVIDLASPPAPSS